MGSSQRGTEARCVHIHSLVSLIMLLLGISGTCGCVQVPEDALKVDVSPEFEASIEASIEASVDAKIASPELMAKVAEDVVASAEFTRALDQSVGDQSVERGLNIGSVSVDGGTGVLLVILLIVAALACYFWFGKGKITKLTDMLINYNEKKHLTGLEKEKIENVASLLGVQKLLEKRLSKVRKEQSNGD